MFIYTQLENLIPQGHPLRSIKKMTDKILRELSPEFDKHFARTGRPSIPPERLLKASILIALYTIRSDRMFCEMLSYNLLFKWFLDMRIDEKTLDPSNFTRLRERFVKTDLARDFFDSIVGYAASKDLLSSEHFTVDGTLIEAWASHKSFKPKEPLVDDAAATKSERDEVPQAMPQDAAAAASGSTKLGKDEMIDFRGQKRCNDTHESTTDPEARLMRKGPGKEAKLSYGGHAIMENRNGLLVDFQVSLATTTEPAMAKKLVERLFELGFDPQTLGADKGYHTKDFIAFLRGHGIRPHVARVAGRRTPGLDGRTTRHEGYHISQKIRKRVEEIFGWSKSFGGLRKTRFIGLIKNEFFGYIVGAAFNLVRLSNLVTQI